MKRGEIAPGFEWFSKSLEERFGSVAFVSKMGLVTSVYLVAAVQKEQMRALDQNKRE